MDMSQKFLVGVCSSVQYARNQLNSPSLYFVNKIKRRSTFCDWKLPF